MKRKECIFIFILCLALAVCSGCGDTEKMDTEDTTDNESKVTKETDLILEGRAEVKYTERDLSGTFDGGEELVLSETQTITEEGVYIISGTLDDGQLIVDADAQAKVQLVLNGVNLSCENGPAIYVKSADKVFLTLAEGTKNSVSDGKSYTTALIKEDEPWGAIFSKDDLTINGTGSLTVTGNYLHGIVSKDSLKLTGGNIVVDAVEDGMRGKDELCIHDGDIVVTAKEDGLKSNNDTDEGKGNVSIDGGRVAIKGTASQSIDAYDVAQILGGTVTLESENEGIQGKHIYIADGEINIDAQDDCVNAKDSLIENSEENHQDALLEIAGGNLLLSTTAGDGLDSNGSVLVTGGKTIVHGAASGVEVAMDYNGTGTIDGGIVLATGVSGMAQNFDESSSQCSLMYNCSGNEGTTVTLLAEDGSQLASFEAEHDFSSVLISMPELKVGEAYTLSVGDTETDITLDQKITSSSGGMGGPGGMGGNRGNMDGRQPNGAGDFGGHGEAPM